MKLCDIDISDQNAMSFHLVDDLSDTEVHLGDYIRLKGLEVGYILYLNNDGGGQKVIFVGNSTPYEGISSISHDGWNWDLYNNWTVNRVYRLQLELSGSFFSPGHLDPLIPKEPLNVSQAS